MTITPDIFDEDYFIRGKELGLSNYVDYSWMGERTLQMARAIQWHLAMRNGNTCLDYGCSRGYLVKALRILGIEATGQDISKWAIENCDPDVRLFVQCRSEVDGIYDFLTCKDVAEHIPFANLSTLMRRLTQSVRRGMLFVVPLASVNDGPYLREEDEMDATHVIRWTLEQWIQFMEDYTEDFTVQGSYHIPGIKPASRDVAHSCGFLTLRRFHQ